MDTTIQKLAQNAANEISTGVNFEKLQMTSIHRGSNENPKHQLYLLDDGNKSNAMLYKKSLYFYIFFFLLFLKSNIYSFFFRQT